MNEILVQSIEAADKPAGSLEAFGQEVLGIADLRAMHQRISRAIHDPGKDFRLRDFTSRAEDGHEQVLAISYLVVPTAGRNLREAGGRGSSCYARMFLPAETARKIYQHIQNDPKRMRYLLGAFEKEIGGYIQAQDPNEANLQWLDTLNFPTSEARVLILPEENKKTAYIHEERGPRVNDEYVKIVQY